MNRHARRRTQIKPDTVFSTYREIDGEFYATITAKPERGEPIIVIAGPFFTETKARTHNGKWLELATRRGQLTLVDMRSVPAEVRRTITDEISLVGDRATLNACDHGTAAKICSLVLHRRIDRNEPSQNASPAAPLPETASTGTS